MTVETPLNETIGRKLRELRESRGIRREQVALALEMGSENLRHYEAGRQKLTVSMLPTIAGVFGMTVADLVVALFDLREICNNQDISANGTDDSQNANYNYTERPSWLSGLGNAPRRSLALATVG